MGLIRKWLRDLDRDLWVERKPVMKKSPKDITFSFSGEENSLALRTPPPSILEGRNLTKRQQQIYDGTMEEILKQWSVYQRTQAAVVANKDMADAGLGAMFSFLGRCSEVYEEASKTLDDELLGYLAQYIRQLTKLMGDNSGEMIKKAAQELGRLSTTETEIEDEPTPRKGFWARLMAGGV